jgi:DNA-binding MarR family transcriptional regulator
MLSIMVQSRRGATREAVHGVSQDPALWPTGHLLSVAARCVEHDWNAHLATWGLTHASLPVLVLLTRHNHSQRELATATGVTQQTMSRILERLERAGYLTRTPHPSDRRQHVIALSAKGATVMCEAADLAHAEAITTRGLTGEQVAQLRTILVALIRARPGPAVGADRL